jgi:hypothetical protein
LQEEEEAEEIYWSSREESTTRFSNSLYDSYDPFSYMADRVSSSYITIAPPPLTTVSWIRLFQLMRIRILLRILPAFFQLIILE